MRFGRNLEVRPLGSGAGCVAMIVVSVIAPLLAALLMERAAVR